MNSQQNSEKNPLDELFARKLGKLEQLPAPDSFARLQQRMQLGREKPRIIVWRNPNLQMAAAACVAIALLMGWFYTNTQSGNTVADSEQTVAVRERLERGQMKSDDKTIAERSTINPSPQVARSATKAAPKRSQSGKPVQSTISEADAVNHEQVVASRTTAPRKDATTTTSTTEKSSTEVIAATKVAPAPQATPKERVLVVTIEEPEALVAARQTAASVVNNMPVLAASPTKEGKATFWKQVKRLKQDDDVARQEGAVDESGLLSRAYKGIKQRLEKDKQTKQ